MKRILYIAILLLSLLAGCTKPDSSAIPEEFDRYIFFSQSIGTRAALIESTSDMAGKTFGVVGYKYDFATDWGTYKADSPAPNVFYDENGVLIDDAAVTLTCDETGKQASYSPLQGWSNIKKYAFFAYYPLQDNVTFTMTDGTPAITYTMDPANYQNSMADVMVAAPHVDKYWKTASDNNVSNGEVALDFSHCLSCLGLKLKNSTTGGITLNSVSINLGNIKHKKVRIPLDGTNMNYPTDDAAVSGNITCALTLQDSEKRITSTVSELSDKLIMIPQTENLAITLTIGYTRSTDGYNDNITSSVATLSTSLTKGTKHLINVNFTESTVDATVTYQGWGDGVTVDNTFN